MHFWQCKKCIRQTNGKERQFTPKGFENREHKHAVHMFQKQRNFDRLLFTYCYALKVMDKTTAAN